MTANTNPSLADEARAWAIRVDDADFADWDGLTAWLEADAAHLAAYDAALDDAAWAERLYCEAPTPLEHGVARPEHRHVAAMPRTLKRWAGGALAASLAVAVGIGGWQALDRGEVRAYATAPGERRTIDLADGSRIVLNGGTRLTVDADDPREVVLVTGEALFDVRHDDRDPFVVTASETRLVDVGTVFNVVALGGALDVTVAEGAVDYESDGGAIRLDAGDALSRSGRNAKPVVRRIERAAVGAWRTGSLVYTDAPLQQVGADLARNLGRPIAVDARLATQRFSGTLLLDGGTEAVFDRTGPLLGVAFERQDDGWKMTPIDDAPS